MTIYKDILYNLERHSWMRTDRHGAIKDMLKEKYTSCTWENIADIAHDWLSYDRVFRQCQSENPHIQPPNYEKRKKIREQEYEMEQLGMESLYRQDIRRKIW
jgi:hypothetical protein